MIALFLTLAKFLLPLLPTAQQRQDAAQAAADNYIKFLQTTDNSLYAAVRTVEIFGAMWDVFFNQGQLWAQAASNLVHTPYGVLELLILIWPFFGNSLSSFATTALQAGLKSQMSGSTTVVRPAVNGEGAGPSPAPTAISNYPPSTSGGQGGQRG